MVILNTIPPPSIIDAARNTMDGFITLDPAASELSNKTVNALRFYSVFDDSLSKKWDGNVWMNHPFGRKNNPLFINKLIKHYQDRDINQACCITFACTSEKWFRPLMDYPQCFIHGRTNYLLPDGNVKNGCTKGSVVTYLGNNVDEFIFNFSKIGTVKI